MAKLDFWNISTEWLKYGLTEGYISLNGEDTGYKAVLRDDEMVAVVRKGYSLFPNEEALALADQAAKLVGLDRFTVKMPGARSQGNIIWGKKRHRMKAIYLPPGFHRVDGDEVNVGVSVHNSIDGSQSFGCGVFTFRGVCSNGVIFGKKDIRSIRHHHTRGLQVALERLQHTMILMMEQSLDIVESYRRMAAQKVTQELLKKIATDRFIPKKILPDYALEEQATIPKLTEWEVYNDVTQAIWHNDTTGLKTKGLQFDALHKIMPLTVRRF